MTRASPRTRHLVQAGTWLIATFVLVVLVRGVDVSRVWAVSQDVRGGWLALAVASNLLVLPLWAQQWRALMPPSSPVAPRRMLSIVAQLSFFANTVPVSGPVSAVVMLSREPGVTSAAALSGLALEQVTEGVVKLSILVVTAQLLPLPDWMHRAVFGLAAAVALLTIAIVAAALHHERINAIVGQREIRSPLDRFLALVARWSRDLESLRRPSRFALALLCCTGSKGVEALAMVAVQHAFGLTLPLSTTMLAFGAMILGTIAPVSPANLGIYEGAVVAAYRHSGIPPELALAVAVVQHACLLLGTAAVGYVVFSVNRLAGVRA